MLIWYAGKSETGLVRDDINESIYNMRYMKHTKYMRHMKSNEFIENFKKEQ